MIFLCPLRARNAGRARPLACRDGLRRASAAASGVVAQPVASPDNAAATAASRSVVALVDQRGAEAGVAHPGHQFLGAGPRAAPQSLAGVAQVVEPEPGQTGPVAGQEPDASPGRAADRLVLTVGENGRRDRGGVELEVLPQTGEQVRGNVHGPDPGGGLGRVQDQAAVAELDVLPADGQVATVQVKAVPSQRQQRSPPGPGPGRQQDQPPVRRRDGVREGRRPARGWPRSARRRGWRRRRARRRGCAAAARRRRRCCGWRGGHCQVPVITA